MHRTVPSIPSLRSRLTPEESRSRDALLDRLVVAGAPVDAPGELQEARLLENLVQKRVVVLDADGRVAFAYPVSGPPTRHRVILEDGRTFSAMCAVDALGSAFVFRQSARIESSCTRCGVPVSARVEPDGAASWRPAELRVLHVDLNQRADWAATS